MAALFIAVGFSQSADDTDRYRELAANPQISLAHSRIAEGYFAQGNLQHSALEFRFALDGDHEPKWIEVWSHLSLGKIFDLTEQRERALNEYRLASRTNDNTRGALDEAAKYLQSPYKRASN